MLEATVLDALLPLIRALETLGIPYYVGGSVASSLWGVIRSTRDADVVAALRPEHVAPLVAALEADYYLDDLAIHEAIRTGRSFNIIHLAAMFKVDVFVPTRPFDQSALRRAHQAPQEHVGAVPFQLSSPEDIIVQKLVWYRLAGEQLQRQWSDVLEVLQVQAPNLDRAYMRHWAAALGVADLLAEAETAAETDAQPVDRDPPSL